MSLAIRFLCSFLIVASIPLLAIAQVDIAGGGNSSSFPGAGVGPIPDRGTAGCGAPAGPPLNITFSVSGLGYPATDLARIEVDMDMTHTWTGDLNAELVAPDGVTSHTLFGRTGATTATGCGDSSDLDTVYTFGSSGSGDFWAAAAAAGATIPGGSYRTSEPGGSPSGGAFTDMLASFAGLADLNGSWTLSVTDFGGGDTGEVQSATLRFVQLIDPIFGDRFEEPPPP